MIMPMRAGRSGKRRLKKRGKVLQMPFVVVNTCTFKLASLFTNKCDYWTYRHDLLVVGTVEVTERNFSVLFCTVFVLDLLPFQYQLS